MSRARPVRVGGVRILLLLACLTALSACTAGSSGGPEGSDGPRGSGGDRPTAAEMERQVDDEVRAVAPLLARELGASVASGARGHFTECQMSDDWEYTGSFALTGATPRDAEDVADALVGALSGAGWADVAHENDWVVGTKGPLQLSAMPGPAAVNVDVTFGCTDLADEDREYADNHGGTAYTDLG